MRVADGDGPRSEAQVGSNVRLRTLKYPTRPHWRIDGELLGRDEFGTWFGVASGTLAVRGAGPPQILTHPFVKLVPDRDWYQLSYFGRGRSHELYVDITTEARWTTPTLVQAVDLDLDVIRHGDGTTAVLDRHEFELHRRRLAYPLDVVEGAEASCAALLAAVSERRTPFDGLAEDWLQHYLTD